MSRLSWLFIMAASTIEQATSRVVRCRLHVSVTIPYSGLSSLSSDRVSLLMFHTSHEAKAIAKAKGIVLIKSYQPPPLLILIPPPDSSLCIPSLPFHLFNLFFVKLRPALFTLHLLGRPIHIQLYIQLLDTPPSLAPPPRSLLTHTNAYTTNPLHRTNLPQ